MAMEELNAFSIQLYKIKIDQWDLKKRSILNLPNWHDPECWINEHMNNHFTDYHKYNGNPPYKNQFFNTILNELNRFSSDIGLNLEILSVWAQRYNKSQFMAPHNHGALGLSAVLFAEFDTQEHLPTSFIAPFLDPITGYIKRYDAPINEGDLLVFPSHLQHHALPNESEKQRTIFSFNMTVPK